MEYTKENFIKGEFCFFDDGSKELKKIINKWFAGDRYYYFDDQKYIRYSQSSKEWVPSNITSGTPIKAKDRMKKSYKISENQIKAIADGQDIRKLFPELFEVKLEVGKVYKAGGCLFNYQKGMKSYGFSDGKWVLSDYWTVEPEKLNEDEWVILEATPQEWEEALIKEAEKRYKDGYCIPLNADIMIDFDGKPYKLNFNTSSVDSRSWLWVSFGKWQAVIFKDGIWSEIIQPITKAKVLEKYGETVID